MGKNKQKFEFQCVYSNIDDILCICIYLVIICGVIELKCVDYENIYNIKIWKQGNNMRLVQYLY